MLIDISLFEKTFLILGSQLLITWASTVVILKYITSLFHSKTQGITGKLNPDGELDLDINWETIKPYFWVILAIDIGLFLLLIFIGRSNLSVGIPVFTLWSIVTGIELALALISVDENLGGRVLALTASVTFTCALIGIYSGIDFSFLGEWLLIALILLIIGNIVRIFFNITRWKQRVMAFIGVVIFIGYLLFDFNRLSMAAKSENLNTWPQAMDFSIEIYLDIINLFLELLDLLSD